MAVILVVASLFTYLIYRSFCKNLYLGFVQAISSLNIIIALGVIIRPADQFILVLGGVLTIATTHVFFVRGIADLQRSYCVIKRMSESSRHVEIAVFILFLLPFYIVLSPQILSGGWWSVSESRIAYMTESSFWLRGVKLTPILIGMIIFSMFNKVDRKTFCLALICTVIFAIFFGSKSGVIFLIALFTVYVSINTQVKRDTFIPFLFIGILLLASVVFFFSKLASESGGSLSDESLTRFGSDVLGYLRAFDSEYVAACSSYNIFSPMVATLHKAFPFLVDPPASYLSMGKCLASPGSVDYPYELLLPLFFELYIIYGAFFSILLYLALVIFLWKFFLFIKRLGASLNVRYTAFCARALILVLSLAVFWGGKFVNFLISDALSCILMLLIVAFITNVLPRRQRHSPNHR